MDSSYLVMILDIFSFCDVSSLQELIFVWQFLVLYVLMFLFLLPFVGMLHLKFFFIGPTFLSKFIFSEKSRSWEYHNIFYFNFNLILLRPNVSGWGLEHNPIRLHLKETKVIIGPLLSEKRVCGPKFINLCTTRHNLL